MAVNVNGGSLVFDFDGNFSKLSNSIKGIEKELQGLTNTAKRESDEMDNLVRKTTLAIGSYASFAAGTNFVRDIVTVRGEFQKLEVSFNTMLKSKDKADKLMAQAVQLAAQTPFTLQEVGSGAKQLLAYGFSAESVTKNLEMLGNVAAGVGAPLGDIVYLYGTLRTQGRAYTRDIMQFTSRGIPIVSELAKQFGITEKEVTAMVEAGKVGFPEVERAFQSMTGQSGLFFNLMQEQSKTLTGMISNLQDAWSRMLNDMGKSNENIFAGAIKGATDVVNNYQDVLDIIKILIATYGSYRAAIIVTNAVTAISTQLTKGWTIAETLRYRAMLLSERAMKILNATMLSNPYVLAATAIAALVTALVVLRKETTNVVTSQKLLADAQESVNDKLAETQAKLNPYIEKLKQANLSEKERLDIYEHLRAIDPDIVKGLNAKTISYQNLAANVNIYIEKLRQQYALEANKEALMASIKQENIIKKKIQEQEKLTKQLKETNKTYGQVIGGSSFSMDKGGTGNEIRIGQEQDRLASLQNQLKEQQDITKQLGVEQVKGETKTQEVKKRTVAVIEEEIKALQDQQKTTSENSKQFQDYQKKINALEAEKKRITGDKKEIASQQKAVDKLKEDLAQLNKDIADAEAEATRSGLLKEESEIDRINKKYDELVKRVQELKLKDASQRNGLIQRIENSRSIQVGNEQAKFSFEEYKKQLTQQKELYDKFEQYKVTYGEQKSKELLGLQENDFNSYLEMLQAELLKTMVSGEGSTLKGKLKIQLLSQAIVDEEKKRAQQMVDDQAKAFEEMLTATYTFKDKENEINKRYDRMEKALENDNTVTNKQERLRILKGLREEELNQLKIDAEKQGEIYKKLNQDITFYSRKQIQELIKQLEKLLKTTTGLSPIVKKQIQDDIENLKGILKETSESFTLGEKLIEAANGIDQVGGSLSSLAQSVKSLDSDLSDVLQGISDAAKMSASALSAAGKFATGDYVGAATDAVNFITQVVEGFAKAKSTRIEAQKQVENFYQTIRNAEFEINELYRQRQREQVKLNKLKLEGINAERKLLQEQKLANEKEFKDLLAQIQREQYVSGQTTTTSRNPWAFFGAGLVGVIASKRTKTSDILSSLAGKSYDELEKLFMSGQLTDKAKSLFEQLQKLKQEGVDIDALLEQNKADAQQLFTGTTSDSITDSILEGFKNGERGAAAFANNFEDLMRNAILQSLKMQYLEGPLQDFYNQFADFAQTDGVLTESEIKTLKSAYDAIINNAQQQFDQLQSITNIGFGSSSSSSTLSNSIKGITETTAQLLAGQFGGLRLTAIDALNISRSQLETQQKIQVNTGLTAERLSVLLERVQYYFEVQGVKIR